jgi:hypothetical protein
LGKEQLFAHKEKDFDLHLIPNRAVFLNWKLQLIMNGMKIMFSRAENFVFLDSISFIPLALPKLTEAFWLTVSNSGYPQYLNTQAALDYVGKIPDLSYCGANEMGASERREFLVWNEGQKFEFFNNRGVLQSCNPSDVIDFTRACQVMRREFIR